MPVSSFTATARRWRVVAAPDSAEAAASQALLQHVGANLGPFAESRSFRGSLGSSSWMLLQALLMYSSPAFQKGTFHKSHTGLIVAVQRRCNSNLCADEHSEIPIV